MLNPFSSERINQLLTALEQSDDPAFRRETAERLRDEVRRSDEASRRTTDRYRHAVEAAQIGVWDWDLVTDRVEWNEHNARIFGVPLSAFEGTSAAVFRCFHPEDRDRVMGWIEEARSQHQHYDHTYRVCWSDGSVRWVRSKAGFDYDGDGRAIRMTGTLVDITDQIHSRRLAESEQRYRTLVEHSEKLIVRLDRGGRHLFVNGAMEKLIPAAVIGRTHRELGMPESLCQVWDQKLAEVFETGRPVELSFEADSPTGLRHYRGRLVPERGEDGGVESVLGMVDDLTDARAAVEEHGQNVALLRAISDSSSDAIFAKDRQGRMTFANPATLALIGRPLDAVLGRTDAEVLIDQAAAEQVMQNDRRIMESGAAETLEEIFRTPDGIRRVWLSRKVPYRDSAGNVVGLLGIGRDVSEPKRATEEAWQARQKLETVINSITDGLLVMDGNWRTTYFSETAARILGVRRDEVLGQVVWDVFPHAKETRFYESYHEAMASGRPQHFDEFYPAPVNEWLECHCYPSEEGLTVYFRDITDRKDAEAALQKSEARFRAVFRAIVEGVVFLNPDGAVEVVNDAVERLHGHTFAELTDPAADPRTRTIRSDGTPFPVEDQPAMVALRTGEAVRDVEMGVRTADGQLRWRLVNAQPVRDDHGALLGAVASFFDITDRRLAEEALRAQRELLGGIIDGIPVMLTIYDPRLKNFRFNREMREVLGWTEADAAEGDFVAKVYPDPVYRLQVVEYMQSLQSGWRDFELTTKNGTKVISSWANIQLADATQIGIGIDLRQRVAAEEALRNSREAMRHSEQRYRSIVEATAQIVWSADSRGKVNLEVPAWQAYTGQTAAEASGFGWLMAIHPDDRAAVSAAWSKAFEHRGVYEAEYRLRRHDGVWRNIRSRGVPVGDGAGEIREYVGTCVDITERKQAEAARRESEIRLQLTTDALPVLISYVDAEQRYRFTNAAYGEWFGFNPQGGRRVHEVVGAETYTARRGYIERALAGEAVVFEDKMHHRIKGPRDTETSYIPDFADDGKTVRGFISLVYDITDRRQAEEALRLAKQQAEEASAAKDQFLAVLSHELRTPLTPVLATAQLLEAEPSLSPEHREMAQLIRRNVELEARLIDDLLDLTRIARNKLELRIESVDVHEKILQVLRMCDEELVAKQLAVTRELSAPGPHVQGDPTRLQQIIWNLVKNAVKFTPASGRITVRTSNTRDGTVVIEVIDTGLGIDASALPRIFDAFEQGGRDVTRQFGGLGLGLAISKALVDMHGGTIAATSGGRGKGACFTVALPGVPAPIPVLPGQSPKPAAGMSRAILLVEDHVDTRQIMTRLLKRFGCTVTSAGTVAEALEFARCHTFDLVISDVGLPDGSGTELMRELKLHHGLRGIALSGYGMDDDLARSKEAGFEVHLTKPVNVHALEDAVRRLATTLPPLPPPA